jgi:hypothetical protein
MIRVESRELGEFDAGQVLELFEKRAITRDAEYWSETAKAWKPLVSFLQDLNNPKARVEMMRCAGIRNVNIPAGDRNDCPACKALQNQTFSIIQAPILPPADCSCEPWCRCTFIAAQ